jgi:hypothetical protein
MDRDITVRVVAKGFGQFLGDKRLVGIVSLGDLAVDTGDEKLAGETLEQVSEPPKAR